MSRIFAYIQVVVIVVCGFGLHLLVKLGRPGRSTDLVEGTVPLVARYGLWLLVIPILWAIFAGVVEEKVGEKSAMRIGGTLTAILVVILLGAIALYLY